MEACAFKVVGPLAAAVGLTLIQFSKVYDTDPRTVSLMNLLVNARNNTDELVPLTAQDNFESIQARIVEISKLLEKLRNYRNKRLVHYDSTDMENLEIPVSEVDMLIEKTKSIFNSFKLLCDGNADNYENIMKEVNLHTDKIIGLMNKEKLG